MQRQHQPGGAVAEGERRAGQAKEQVVVRAHGVPTRRQAGHVEERIVAEQRSRHFLHSNRRTPARSGRRARRILLQVAHRSHQGKGKHLNFVLACILMRNPLLLLSRDSSFEFR